jgi:hypothetical protein
MLPVVCTTLSPEESNDGRYSVTTRIETGSWIDWAISLPKQKQPVMLGADFESFPLAAENR